MFLLVIWVALSIAVGSFADKKGLSGFGWFLAAIFVSPLVAGIFVALAEKNKTEIELRVLAMGEMKKCSHCAELIRKEASKCRFCGEAV
jgi:hypothetical protein